MWMRSSPHPATVLLWYPKFLARCCSRNFDHCHSHTSLHLPLAALGSLPTGQLHLNGFESASNTTKSPTPNGVGLFVVGEDGFEPSKRNAADLQSVPFGHSGTPPYAVVCFGAGRRTRTPDLLITNQLLYRLSYTGGSNRTRLL